MVGSVGESGEHEGLQHRQFLSLERPEDRGGGIDPLHVLTPVRVEGHLLRGLGVSGEAFEGTRFVVEGRRKRVMLFECGQGGCDPTHISEAGPFVCAFRCPTSNGILLRFREFDQLIEEVPVELSESLRRLTDGAIVE